MVNNPFGDIGAKKKAKAEDFIEDAKVDGSKKLDQQARRGANYKDTKTGETINLGGKVLQVPLNAYELKTLSEAALQEGLPLATFLRVIALKHVKNM